MTATFFSVNTVFLVKREHVTTTVEATISKAMKVMVGNSGIDVVDFSSWQGTCRDEKVLRVLTARRTICQRRRKEAGLSRLKTHRIKGNWTKYDKTFAERRSVRLFLLWSQRFGYAFAEFGVSLLEVCNHALLNWFVCFSQRIHYVINQVVPFDFL